MRISLIKTLLFSLLVWSTQLQAQMFGYGCGTQSLMDPNPIGPIRPCHWGVQAKAGLVPTYYAKPQENELFAVLPPPPGILDFNTKHQFSDYFHLPWTAALEGSYNLDNHWQIFLEGMWKQARGKTATDLSPGFNLKYEVGDYRAWGVYFGGRYYFDRFIAFCSGISPFIGAKVGFMRRETVTTSVYGSLIGTIFPFGLGRHTLYREVNSASGGIQAGIDFACTDWFSVVLTAEALVARAIKPNSNVLLPFPGINVLSFGKTGLEISVPVTLGLRLTF